MMTILECDIGNSACKWRVTDHGVVIGRGSFPHQRGFSELVGVAKQFDRIRFSSVAASAITDQFKDALSNFAVPIYRAITHAEAAGVVNSYADPSRMGVDRWLAVIAAYHRNQKAAMIIDAGSALTLDLVSSTGAHLGGYIIPGEHIMRSSLLSDTGSVRFDTNSQRQSLALGRSTDEAVYAGVLAAQCGAVHVAIEQANLVLNNDFEIAITGGAAKRLLNALPAVVARRAVLEPELVLDGLAWVLP